MATLLPPVARFGMACGLLGLPVARAGDFLNTFEAELGKRFAVRVSDEGRSLAVATIGTGADFVARAQKWIAAGEPERGGALAQIVAAGGPTMLQVRLGRDIELGIEQFLAGPVGPVMEALASSVLLPIGEARELAAMAGMIANDVDAVGWTRHEGESVVRAVFAAAEAGKLQLGTMAALDVLGVSKERRDFVAAVYGPLGGSGVVVRVGAGGGGVDRLAFEVRNVSADNTLKIWQTVSPTAGFPTRFGGLVGALGVELCAALELTYTKSGVSVSATFELGDQPVTLPLRR